MQKIRQIETKFLHAGRTLVSTPGMHEMAAEIVKILATSHCNATAHLEVPFKEFASGEDKPILTETVRGEHVFLLCGLQHPDPDKAVGRMMRLADALMGASVDGISLVAPFLPFLRQDRKDEPRAAISARVLAKMIQSNHAIKRVITFDMHAPQIEGFFDIPVDNLRALILQAAHLRKRFNNDFRKVTIVAPDVGSAKRAQQLARLFGPKVPVAIIDKRRMGDGEAEVFAVIGRARGRDCVLVDDMIDGGGTIRSAEKCLMEKGARSVCTYATHMIFSGNAVSKFAKSRSHVVGTQTIPRTQMFRTMHGKWYDTVPIEPFLANAIHQASIVGGSISGLTA